MEAVIFCGIQASGKTTFYKERFLKSHVRISLDMLKTKNRIRKLLEFCLETQQPFVSDNTNSTAEERKKYIQTAKDKGFKVIGFYFQSKLADSIERNKSREGEENIPDKGIMGTYKKLEIPKYDEGFDILYYVEIHNSTFIVKEWDNEI